MSKNNKHAKSAQVLEAIAGRAIFRGPRSVPATLVAAVLQTYWIRIDGVLAVLEGC